MESIQRQLNSLIEQLRLSTIRRTDASPTITPELAEELLRYISGANHAEIRS